MRLPATKFIVFNAAAGLVGVAALVTAVKTVLLPASIAPCTERYHSMTGFALERAGVALTAADLQASLGGKDVGVIDNVTIGPVKDAPAPLAISVALVKAAGSAQGAADPKAARRSRGNRACCRAKPVHASAIRCFSLPASIFIAAARYRASAVRTQASRVTNSSRGSHGAPRPSAGQPFALRRMALRARSRPNAKASSFRVESG